jgi:hypothetical protein
MVRRVKSKKKVTAKKTRKVKIARRNPATVRRKNAATGRSKSAPTKARKAALPDEPPIPVPEVTPLRHPASWAEARAIADIVRAGGDASKLVSAVLLNEHQRDLIREANKRRASEMFPKSSKRKRPRRGTYDIYRKGIRMPGSFESRR